MKFFGLFAILCGALLLSGCGSSDSTAKAPEETEPKVLKPFVPKIDPPKTLPTKLIIRDLREGSGPGAEPGDELTLDYYSINEKDELVFSSRTAGFEFELGTGDYWSGWEQGLEGMKAGGRREILMPKTMTKNQGYLFYIVDLNKIDEPPTKGEEEEKEEEEPAEGEGSES